MTAVNNHLLTHKLELDTEKAPRGLVLGKERWYNEPPDATVNTRLIKEMTVRKVPELGLTLPEILIAEYLSLYDEPWNNSQEYIPE